MTNKKFLRLGFMASILLAGLVSFYASSHPDGLEKVAQDIGFIKQEKDHSLSNSPVAGYEVKGLNNDRLSVGAAGIIGVVIMAAGSTLIFRFLRKR